MQPTSIRTIVGAYFLFATAVGIVAVPGASWGSGFVQDPTPLELAIAVDRQVYRPDDRIVVKFLLTNTSKQPIYLMDLFLLGESGSFSLWVRDVVSGRDSSRRFADEITPPPQSVNDFVRLRPEHVFGVSLRILLADIGVRRAGKYELAADYHSRVPAGMTFGLPTWTREKGAIHSTPVTIVVER